MQACLPRSYLIPVRDEEAESQRKARSRHIRQTRRSTQGVTLAELKEAQRNYSPSLQDTDGQIEDGCSRMCDRSSLKGIGEARSNLAQCLEAGNPSHTCSWEIDKIGNQRQKWRTQASGSIADLANPPSDPWHYYIPPYTSSSLANSMSSRVVKGEDEQKHDSTEDPSKCVLSTREKKVWFYDQDADKTSQVFEVCAWKGFHDFHKLLEQAPM
ncbi:protein phosphatase 1 regulatory subunit 12B-like [Esox lucius]|uniref:protein phosphatase 1 regulatory subunit 12B-like n=1 Tax=Esox lucius TaxID=8010 RepID=UPI0014775C4B|nr:protein phosphatase 1 regulatory subunit 12B-like [Esox lucius]